MFNGITTAELGIDGALMVALSGFVTVFMMLGCLAILIVISSKVIGAIESKKKPAAAPAAKKAAPAPVAAPAAPAQDEDELVAVAMAAIAEETGCSVDSFRITGIQSR